LDHREKPPPDTLASEVTDQADPEFKLLSKGDNCISQDDLLEFVESQLPPPPDCDPGVPPGHCKQEMAEYHEIKEAMVSYGTTMHAYADRCVTGEEDGCVDEKEFVTMNEMEGPPPGFEEEAAEGMVEGDMEPAHSAPDCAFFDADGDGKISKKEAVAKSKELEPLNRQRMFLKIAQKTMNAALTDPFSAHFFVRRASDPQYVDYIGKKGFEELSDSDRLIKDEKLTDLSRELEVFAYKSKDAETWANKFVDIDDYTKFPDYLLKTVRYGPVSDKNPLKPEFKAEQEAAMKSPERRDPSVGAGG